MPYALELAVDGAAAAVRRVWRELDDAGISYMARSGARPIDRAAFESELTRVAAETAPLPITLASVGLFPTVAVFLAPTVTAELLDLHADVHRRFRHLGTAPWRYYAPGVWVPHCTLASDLAPDQFATALEIARRARLPLECRLVEIGIVEFRPVNQLISRALGGR